MKKRKKSDAAAADCPPPPPPPLRHCSYSDARLFVSSSSFAAAAHVTFIVNLFYILSDAMRCATRVATTTTTTTASHAKCTVYFIYLFIYFLPSISQSVSD